MKHIFKFLSVSVLLVFLCVANVYAYPIEGTYLNVFTGDYRAYGASGGEFRLTQKGGGYSFLSFCVEIDEYISLGTNYDFYVESVSLNATNGGAGGAVENKDPISDASQWLAYNWFYDYDAELKDILGEKSDANAQIVQNAIWHFEEEKDFSGNAIVAALKLNSEFFNGVFFSSENFDNMAMVVNLTSGGPDGEDKQSQLVARVSEPATMLLLGTSLFGLGALSRRKFKK